MISSYAPGNHLSRIFLPLTGEMFASANFMEKQLSVISNKEKINP